MLKELERLSSAYDSLHDRYEDLDKKLDIVTIRLTEVKTEFKIKARNWGAIMVGRKTFDFKIFR